MAEPTWHVVMAEEGLPEGSARVVVIDGEEILLCRSGGKLFALENRCSHDDGPLGEGRVDAGAVTCPRHGARFDLETGAPLSMPAVVAIETYAVKIEGGQILLAID